MTLYPGASWRPMPGQEKRARRAKGRGVGFHIAVTERSSIYDINLGTGNDAHLYVRRDGTVEQNIDLDLVAYAGAAGNGSMIWVETQGGTTAADVKSGRWDAPQAETLAQIAAWANRTEGTPLGLMPNALPGSRGLATHRLGIKHSAGLVPGWWFPGCELWSSAVGKECPGDARVAQLREISARAQQIAGGINLEDDMQLTDRVTVRGGLAKVSVEEALAAAFTVYDAVFTGGTSTPEGKPLAQVIGGIQATVGALTETVRTLAAARGGDLDVDALLTRVEQTVKAAMADTVTVDVTVGGKPAGS